MRYTPVLLYISSKPRGDIHMMAGTVNGAAYVSSC